jgi:hypothetical protein
MYDGRFGEIECFVCEEEILSGDKEAFSLYNGRDLEPEANAGSWVCGSDCNETYAEFWAESQIG